MWLCGCKAIFLSNNRDDEGMEDMTKETLWSGSILEARREEGVNIKITEKLGTSRRLPNHGRLS